MLVLPLKAKRPDALDRTMVSDVRLRVHSYLTSQCNDIRRQMASTSMFDVTHKQSQCNSLDVGLYLPLYSERRPRSSNETMVNKCALEYCRTGKDQPSGDTKKSVFKFPLDDTEICQTWTYFVGKKDWRPSKYSVICEDH